MRSPISPAISMPGVHPLIRQVIGRCLEANPAKRPVSVVHVAAVLSRAARLGGSEVSTDVAHQRPPAMTPQPASLKLAWSIVGASLVGALLLLMVAPVSTGIALSFDRKGAPGGISQVFSWMWCIALQLLIILGALAYVMRIRSHPGPSTLEEAEHLDTLH